MSFAVSLDRRRLEYAGKRFCPDLFAQPGNMLKPRFWSMLRDLLRFYRQAPRDLRRHRRADARTTISTARWLWRGLSRRSPLSHGGGDLVDAGAATFADYPAATFIRFCDNHGLLQSDGPPAMAHRRRRQPRLCQASDRALRRPASGSRAPSFQSSATAPGSNWSTPRAAASASTHVVIAAHADQALNCWRRRATPSASCSAPSATPKTRRSCIPTPT